MKTLSITLLTIFCVINTFPQQDTISGSYKLRGKVKDQDSAVFTRLDLYISKGDQNRKVATDINGEFEIGLSAGNYEITVNPMISKDFRAFIKIQEIGLNPNNIEFEIDSRRICYCDSSGDPFPKIINVPKPPYPAAARAVRASGEVVVAIKVGQDGKVISASAESGHPLLRSSAVAASRSATFEVSDSSEERDVRVTFVFLVSESMKEGIARYTNPYRIEVAAPPSVIDY